MDDKVFQDKEVFHHIRGEDGGVVTIVFKPDTNRGDKYRFIEYAVSWCSPKDQWNRKKGNKIAVGRLKKMAQVLHVEVDPTKPFFAQVKKQLRTAALHDDRCPRFAQKLLKQ